MNIQNKFFQEINNIKILNIDEEKEIMKRAKEGCEDSKQKLIISNLKFVVSIARKYENNKCKATLMDLITDGILGLVVAIDKFDVNKNKKFITYAVWWVRVYILRAIYSDYSNLKLPSSMQNIIIEKLKNNEEDELPYYVYECFVGRNSYVSFDKSSDKQKYKLSEIIKDQKAMNPESFELDKLELECVIYSLISYLNDLERDVISYVYGIKNQRYTIDQTSQILGVSKNHIRIIRDQALNKIRRNKEFINYKDVLLDYIYT